MELLLNTGPDIRLLGRPDPFYALFIQYLITFCSQPETVSDVLFGRFLAGYVAAHKPDF